MIDIDLIEETIKELEQGETTFLNCQNLAALYAVRDHYAKIDKVESELSDILPQYKRYCEIKRKYQLKELSEENVLLSMKDVCIEIKDFIHTLYYNTDTKGEREQLKLLITELFKDMV